MRWVTFSPDGKRVATASADNTARIWSSDGTGTPLVLKGHTGPVFLVSFSPDGRQLLTASEDGTAQVWDTTAGGLPRMTLHAYKDQVYWATFSPDGRSVAAGFAGGTARIWEVGDEGVPVVLDCQEPVSWLGYTPDGKVLATPSAGGSLRMWDLDTDLLQQRIRASSTACIPVEERVRYLGMSPAEACGDFNTCEKQHGRPTVPGCNAQRVRP